MWGAPPSPLSTYNFSDSSFTMTLSLYLTHSSLGESFQTLIIASEAHLVSSGTSHQYA